MKDTTSRGDQPPPGRDSDREARIAYVQAMLAQLRAMAEADGCDMLAYLIEMASLEAGELMRDRRPLRARSASRPGAKS